MPTWARWSRAEVELDVAEAVDMDDGRPDPALADARRGQVDAHELCAVERRPQRAQLDSRSQVSRGGREDVAAVEGVGDRLEPVGGICELDRLLDAAEPVGREHEKAVVRADVHAAVAPAKGDRLAVAAHARVDDCEVDALRHVRNRAREHQRALDDVVRRDPVRDVDHLGLGGDALDHSVARADEVVLEAEVRQEGDEPAFDAASLTAATRPSRS